MPLGRLWGKGMWGCVTFYDIRKPPVASGDKFIVDDDGLAKQLAKIFTQEAYDSLRDISRRPRWEVWVRWNWSADEIAPGAFDLPAHLKYGPPGDPMTAMRQAAARTPPAPGSYERLRIREKAQRDAAPARNAAEEATVTAQPAQDHSGLLRFSGIDPDADRNSEAAHAANWLLAGNAEAARAAVPEMMSREQQIAAKKRKEKAAKASRSQVAATAANKKAAKEWADKQVEKLDRAGKFHDDWR
jgi:hypothetical protein